MLQDGAGGVVALARAGHGHAGGGNVAAILSRIELPAKLTSHRQVKVGLLSIRGVLAGTQHTQTLHKRRTAEASVCVTCIIHLSGIQIVLAPFRHNRQIKFTIY